MFVKVYPRTRRIRNFFHFLSSFSVKRRHRLVISVTTRKVLMPVKFRGQHINRID